MKKPEPRKPPYPDYPDPFEPPAGSRVAISLGDCTGVTIQGVRSVGLDSLLYARHVDGLDIRNCKAQG